MQTTKGMQDAQNKVTSGVKKLGARIFGKKLTPEEQMVQEQVRLAESRKRSNYLASKLLAIDYFNTKNGLPQEIIRAENYPEVMAYLAKQLRDAEIIQLNVEGIDKAIEYAADAFIEAIKSGRPNVAQWACNALSNEILLLRQDIPATDAQWAEDVQKAREDYVSTYEGIIECCKKLDDNDIALSRLKLRKEEKRQEHNNRLAEYNALINTEDGQMAVINMEKNVDTPGQMSEAAKELRIMMNGIAGLKGEFLELGVSIDVAENESQTLLSNIETMRNKLATPPNAYDPHLLDKIDTINEKFRDRIRKSLQDLDEFRKNLQKHNSEILNIMNSDPFISLTSDALTEMENIQNEELRKQEEAARARMMMQRRQAEQARQEEIRRELEEEEEVEEEEEINVVYEED